MEVKFIEYGPNTRCYKCGTTEVEYICHHCGKPMCAKHTFFASVRDKEKLLSREFTELDLTKSQEEPFHCSDCIHIVWGKDWKKFIAGIILIGISLIAIPNNRFGFKLLGISLGAGVVVYGVCSNRHKKIKALESERELPVIPQFNSIHIKERLSAWLTCDAKGKYTVTADPAKGQLDINLRLNQSDYERLDKYRQKYRKAEYSRAKKFHAGFVALEGSVGIKFNSSINPHEDFINYNNTVISLIDRVINQPLLKGASPFCKLVVLRGTESFMLSLLWVMLLQKRKASVDKPNVGIIQKSFSYTLLETPPQNFFPIHLVLSFLPRSDQRGIEIGIQWTKPEYTNTSTELWKELWNLEIDRIEFLKLSFTRDWGEVEKSSHDGVYDPQDSTITWKQVQLSEQDLPKHRCALKVEFENQIEPLDSSVSGEIKVVFKGTVSGLKNVNVYFPNGKLVKPILNSGNNQKKLIISTEVNANFKLSLSKLRYQYIREIPEPNKNEKDKNKNEELIFNKISPNYKTIIKITDAMSDPDQGFYINRIIEQKPTINAQEDITNRVWTISGRWYDGIYPIEFKLHVRGHEPNSQTRQTFPVTIVKRKVMGTYPNPEMEEKIENVWEKLDHLIRDLLDPLSETKEAPDLKGFSPSSPTERN